MEVVPERYDDEDAQYPADDAPDSPAELEALAEFADCMAAINNNLASIAHSLHGLLEVARVKAPRKPAVPAEPVPVPPELAGLSLYREDQRLCRKWEELKKVWAMAYPGVNVIGEVRRAHAWEVSNPAKVKKDRLRFLANWLAREQDRGRGPVKSSGPAPKSEDQRRHDDAQMQRYLEGKFGGQG